MKTDTPPLLITFALVCFALVQNAQAVLPPPDGGYGPPDYGAGNTAEGQEALLSLTTGTYNTADGYLSLRSNTTGNFNTAIGAGTLLFNTADQNTATGAAALLSNTTGNLNTANGEAALFSNTTGSQNTAIGVSALQSNTTGSLNTASGVSALQSNTTGVNNTADGGEALFSNTAGTSNTAAGFRALQNNTIGADNTALGRAALLQNTTGVTNTAIGRSSLFNNTTGSTNTALGFNSGVSVTTASNVICIGANIGGANVSNSCYVGSIFGQTSSAGTAVFINSDGKLGTATSSKRFKEDIKPMDKTSEVLFSLKPVSFRYKNAIDPATTSQLGLVAEDVEKVNPDLVVRDKEGNPYSVRYDQVNAMLLNEFLKAHQKMEEQGATIAKQQKQIEALAAGLQRVSAQLEASKSRPQVVAK
jgi:trimeric autotransporter adhesin